MSISFQKTFYILASAIGIVFILVVGKVVLFPLATALLIACILLPIAKKLESWGLGRTAATTVTMTSVTLILIAIVSFFSFYMMDVMEEMTRVQTDMSRFFSRSVIWFNDKFTVLPDITREEAMEQLETKFKDASGTMVGNFLNGTGAILTGGVSTFIFTFFFLLYRRGLSNSLAAFTARENRSRTIGMFHRIQKVGQKYLGGMAKLILILGSLNSLGLFFIGVENPFLFGFMAATLSIIPYVGTTVGAIIPVIFTVVSQDASWMPLAVMAWFGFVQFLEGNFLSPLIVGTSVDLNALAAFASLLIGAAIWGVAGMILFLPYIAMLKVVSKEYDELEPLAHLLSEGPYGEYDGSGTSINDKIKGLFKN